MQSNIQRNIGTVRVASRKPTYATLFPERPTTPNVSVGSIVLDTSDTYFNLSTQVCSIPSIASAVGTGWNYYDGFYSIYAGIQQIRNDDDYRQTANKIKGVLNILSGVQLCAACLSGGTLTNAAYALSALTDLVSTTIDYCHAAKEVTFEGWLEERVEEIEFNKKRIANPKTSPEKKRELEEKNSTLLTEVKSYYKVHCETANESSKKIADEHCKKLFSSEEMTTLKTTKPSDADRETTKKIQEKTKKNFETQKNNLIQKSITFVGTVLLAISPFLMACPPLALACMFIGLAMVMGVQLYSTHKSNKEQPPLKPATNGFFSRKPEREERAQRNQAMNWCGAAA